LTFFADVRWRLIFTSIALHCIELNNIYVTYEPTTLHNRRRFGGCSQLMTVKRVFQFSLQHVSYIFLVLKRSERDIIVDVHRSSRKVPVILAKFHESRIFSTDFGKILKYQVS